MELTTLWQNIYQEAVELAETVEGLPDHCECADADAHLEGRCSCCARHGPQPGDGGKGRDCRTLLGRLQADIELLLKDFSRIAEPLEAAGLLNRRFELRRGVFLTGSDLQRLYEAVERAGGSVMGFRRDCTMSEMRKIKLHCAELREHCERLNAEILRGGG